jgi:hypothetical protein
VDGVAAEAGAVCALGDHPGLGGGTLLKPGHADASYLKEGATPSGQLSRTPSIRSSTSENSPSTHSGE